MDPYLEHKDLWLSFHNGLAYEIQAHLNQYIQPSYFARTTARVIYDVVEISAGPSANSYAIYPDVGVWESASSGSGIAVAASTITPAPVESLILQEIALRQHSVEIRQTETKMLVTVIEILSPVNKRPGHEAYEEYLRKRRDILRSSVHLLEIDLLRAGTRPRLERPVPPAPYYIVLSRANRRPKVEVWPIQLAERLPVLPVPLLEPDPDTPLDLAQVVASVYERGAYGVEIDYRQQPPPPLSEAEAAWVERLLHEAGSH
jgi:hypothetical protein